MDDEEKPKESSASEKPSPDGEMRQMIREDIEEQRKLVEKLRRKIN